MQVNLPAGLGVRTQGVGKMCQLVELCFSGVKLSMSG